MHIKTRNVASAFYRLVSDLQRSEGEDDAVIKTVATSSRYGPVRMIPEPVIISYQRPLERVLVNPVRDCNCFFHVFESLWMLAGRKDVAPLAYYNAKMVDFSDDGMEFNAAYGWRWREHYGIDQLAVIVDQLRRKMDSRRCVLQIWSAHNDLLRMDSSKDLACNSQAYFLINPATGALDITVCNRSNDLVWGCLGANAVQFSFLLEYMAACIGVPVGAYHQVTNNLHYYLENKACPWTPDLWLKDVDLQQPYNYLTLGPKLVQDPATFDREVRLFIDLDYEREWKEPFLELVAKPLCRAFTLHKGRRYEAALNLLRVSCAAPDWQLAATQWITKRKELYESKNAAFGIVQA